MFNSHFTRERRVRFLVFASKYVEDLSDSSIVGVFGKVKDYQYRTRRITKPTVRPIS